MQSTQYSWKLAISILIIGASIYPGLAQIYSLPLPALTPQVLMLWASLKNIVYTYFLGAIPVGLVLVKIFGGQDPRKVGSGNVGATNILRASSKSLAAATLILDMGKGALAVYLCSPDPFLMVMGGILVVLGHVFSIFLKGQGGKGFATILGVFLALSWPFGIIVVGVAAAIIFNTRMVSLAALLSVGVSPMIAFLLEDYRMAVVSYGLSLLLFCTHWENIQRLLRGIESKIGDKSNGAFTAS